MGAHFALSQKAMEHQDIISDLQKVCDRIGNPWQDHWAKQDRRRLNEVMQLLLELSDIIFRLGSEMQAAI